MENKNLNKLIGVPFRLNKKDFSGCDCRGIVCLYYQYIKNKIIPFTDSGRIFLRNRKKDKERIISVLKTFCQPIDFKDLDEGDILLLNNFKNICVLGVCINRRYVLHMDKHVGSCLTALHHLKDLFLIGFRPQ